MEATTSEISGQEHVLIRNRCWKLFNFIPLVSGNATNPDKFHSPVVLFRDDTEINKIQRCMSDYARKRRRRAEDLVYHEHESVIFDLPLINIPIPIPYVFCSHDIQLSGVMK